MEQFVYMLVESDRPFYVGKAKNLRKRKTTHISKARHSKENYPIYNKIRKLLKNKTSFEIVAIEDGLTEDNVDERERYWIKKYRENGHKLYNVSEGGEGGKGFTSETIEKIRKAHIGQKISPETRRKISEARKGMIFSEEHKRNLSKAWKNRVVTEETKRKMSESSRGKINIKKYILTAPDGKEHVTERGLTDFCRQHNLTPANLFKVLNNERKDHKGWTIRRAVAT